MRFRITNKLGHIVFIKRILIIIFGIMSYRRFNGFNKLKIKGSDNIKNLQKRNVLFISNHQTYFAEVAAIMHTFSAIKNGIVDSLKNFLYILNPETNLYFVAAKETTNENLLSKAMSYVGAIKVERTWREKGKEINKSLNIEDTKKIGNCLKDGWVLTFPQGTTKPYSKGRKGTAHIIKKYKPIVIPIQIDGFRRAYDKKGLFIKKKGVEKSLIFKKPLCIDYKNDSIEMIMNYVMNSIEQTKSFLKVKTI